LGVASAGQREGGEGSVQAVAWEGVELQGFEQDDKVLPKRRKGERSP
jgi:hypothetical protein